MRYVLFIIVAIFCSTLGVSKANVFEYKIKVQGISEKSTQEAKYQALEDGRRKALLAVISKVVIWDSLAKVNSLLQNIKPYTFEKKFRIEKESISNKQYSAEVSFIFDDKAVISFLESNDILYTLVDLGSYIVLPSFYPVEDSKEDTQWLDFWIDITPREENLGNKTFLSNFIYYQNKSIFENKKNLDSIKKNLNIKEIYLVDLFANSDGTYTLKINSVEDSQEFKFEGLSSINEAILKAPSVIESKEKSRVINSYLQENSEQLFTVPSSVYTDWLFIEKELSSSEDISSFAVDALFNNNVVVKIKHRTNLEKFKKSMLQRCIEVDISTLRLSKLEGCN